MATSFLKLSEVFEQVEQTASRNEMTQILKNFYETLSEQEVQIVSYMLEGRVAPFFIPAEYNFSEKSVLNVLSALFVEDVIDIRGRTGDIGLTVFEVLNQKKSNLLISEIYDSLWSIVNTVGTGSIERKSNIVASLLSSMSPIEGKYFARIVSGNLRLGASVRTLLDAFSFSLLGDKSGRDLLDHAYGVSTDVGYIAKLVYGKNPEKALKSVTPFVGTPVNSRLVERVGSFDELFERLGESFIVQPKYDGLRCQIHKSDIGFDKMYEGRVWGDRLELSDSSASLFGQTESFVRLFTRNLEDVTEMFPEIVEAAKALPAKSFILDSEVIGWDGVMGVFKSYQETMTRRRKHGVKGKAADVPVKAFLFDLMYLDGNSMLEVDTNERLEKLKNLDVNNTDCLIVSESLEVSSVIEARRIFDEWVEQGLEGLIAKKLSGYYYPGKRNFEWIKVKKSMEKGVVDTVDLVVLGYYRGSGKRAGFGMGAILGGVYNSALDRFESVTKIGTGITDELFEKMFKRLSSLEVSDEPKGVLVNPMLLPDVWVRPEVVITVEADEITKAISRGSGQYAGGLSLRFPRLIEFDRDKSAQDATTVEELEDMYKINKK